MAHAPPRTFEQAVGVGQVSAMEEADVHVRLEGVDVAERRILDTGHRAAVVEHFADVGATVPHAFKPRPRHQPQGIGHADEPGLDPGITSNGAREPQKPIHVIIMPRPTVRVEPGAM